MNRRTNLTESRVLLQFRIDVQVWGLSTSSRRLISKDRDRVPSSRCCTSSTRSPRACPLGTALFYGAVPGVVSHIQRNSSQRNYRGAMALFGSRKTGVIADQPRIVVLDDFATADECTHFISLVDGDMEDARVVSEASSDVMAMKRSASVGWVEPTQTPMVSDVVARVADAAEMPERNIESMQVVHYLRGDQHALHYDTFDPAEPAGAARIRQGGQRLRTGLLYLAAPSAGGGTAFPKVKARVKPKPGRLVLFDLVLPDSTDPDPASIHTGLPVIAGEKWACNFWFRDRAQKKTSGRTGGGARKKKRKKR